MPPKDASAASSKATLSASKDADLLKAVIKATGGVTAKGSKFWNDVASAMSEDIKPEAARKRYDKFKPSATPSTSSTAKDADLLKAVIKSNGGVTAKGSQFWKNVAEAMQEDVKPEAARKRFDKFRPKVAATADGAGDDDDGAVKKPAKKRAPAKLKAAGNGKKAAEGEEKDWSDGEQAVINGEDDAEDGIALVEEKKIDKVTKSCKTKAVKDAEATKSVEDEEDDGDEAAAAGEEKKVKKAAKIRKPKAPQAVKAVEDAEETKPEANVSKKRGRSEDLSSGGEAEEGLGEELLEVETPAAKKGRTTKGKAGAEKAKVGIYAIEDVDDEEA